MANLTSSALSAPALSFLSATQQEALLLSAFDGADLSVFPFLDMSPEEQYKAGCQYCWDMYGNCFPHEENLGHVNPVPVISSRKEKKSTFWGKVVKVLNRKLF